MSVLPRANITLLPQKFPHGAATAPLHLMDAWKNPSRHITHSHPNMQKQS